MTTVETNNGIHTREFQVRDFNEQAREFTGIAVPWDQPVEIRDWFGSYTEQFARGSVKVPNSGKVLIYWRHETPIGVATAYEDTDEGWQIRGRISETALGDEAYTLLRDGVVEELSIGFLPVTHEEDDKTGAITRTEVLAREVSLTPFGAYGEHAAVSEVRHNQQHTTAHERSTQMETTSTPEGLTEVREQVEELERSFNSFASRLEIQDRPTFDTRSAGAFLRAIVDGDEAAIAAYNRSQEHRYDEAQHRAYTGGTSADAPIKDAWVGDLTSIFDSSSGILSEIFSTGTLPKTGMNVEFARLLAKTGTVAEQEDEGDDLGFLKVTLETDTAPVATYGGYTQLTRQAIERSTLPLLSRNLEWLSVAAGANKKAVLRTAFEAVVTARTAIAANAGVIVLGAVLGSSTAAMWEAAIRKAAIRYSRENKSPEALIVSESVFDKLQNLAVTPDRLMRIAEGNSAGTLNLLTIKGVIAGLPVYLDPDKSGDSAVFVHSEALRQYDSALVSLQDENVINLSKDFSVYRYGAVADEIPQLVVPVKLAAS